MTERRELVVLLLLAVAGAALFGYFVTNSPTASVRLSHSQAEATDTATAFLEERGFDAESYRTSTVFTARDQSSTFIQRRLSGSREVTALRENDIYFWETRFYRPLEQETFRVAVDARSGAVVGFRHVVSDEAAGGELSTTAARKRAESFLEAQGHDLGDYELISSASTERPNRVDHSFVWKHTTRRVAGAPYQLEVELHGDRIGWYDAEIDVPDGFTHQYEIQQNRGQLLSFAFLGLSLVLAVGSIVFGLRYYKADEFDGRFAVAVGGFVTLLTVVSGLNSIPSLVHNLPTTIAPWQFILLSVGSIAIGGVVLGGITVVMAGTGKQLSADVLGYDPVARLEPLRVDAALRRGVRNQLVSGVLIAGIVLGVYAVFYLVGTRFFGFWLPAQPPQVGAVSVYVPALMALVVAGTAALWEEVTFRLFAIPLTKRYLRYTALAVLVPAVVWGLGHSGYTVLPFWARAVEVSLIGVVLGVAFLRYGLVATVAAHFTLNAFVTALPMLLATTGWLVANGLVALLVAAIPLVAAAVLGAYDRRSAPTAGSG